MECFPDRRLCVDPEKSIVDRLASAALTDEIGAVHHPLIAERVEHSDMAHRVANSTGVEPEIVEAGLEPATFGFIDCLYEPEDLLEFRLIPSGKQFFVAAQDSLDLHNKLLEANAGGECICPRR